MPEKYVHRDGLPLFLRHNGASTLPQDPPSPGRGPAVLCLHDAGLQSSLFGGLLAALGPDTRAIAFDLPAHGRSGSLDALPSIEEMAETASWVASWCRAERPLLVGHGMGALLALEWAQSQGDSISGLVLCGVGLSLGISDEAIETMRRVTRGKAPRPFDPKRVSPDGSPDLMKRAYMEGLQTDPRATLVDLEASRRWSDAFSDSARSIACPCRVLGGAAEPPQSQKRAEDLSNSLSQATFSLVEGAAHLLPLEQPAGLASEVREMAAAL
jgi:pimeloyl-ACP methyl ester carboxylesterase